MAAKKNSKNNNNANTQVNKGATGAAKTAPVTAHSNTKNTQPTVPTQPKSKFREKLEMYDMIVANLIAGKSIIEPSYSLDNSQLCIGFSNIASEEQISKYFLVRQFPDWLEPRFIDNIRYHCIKDGVKINFFFYGGPHKINWESAEMKNKMIVWKQYADQHSGPIDVFDYRTQRSGDLARQRIMTSTQYLNEAELDHKRSLLKVAFMIEISAKRDEESILNMIDSINALKACCAQQEIKLKELRVNMIDWLQTLGVFCMRQTKEVANKISYKVMTDDIIANFNSYKQGRVGNTGVSLGIDVLSGVPVMRKFKADPDAAENWLISAETGGGKSYFVKALLTYLLADGFVVTVMDYEGDEYLNLANYIRAGNEDDVKVISMGKGSTTYFDPCAIPDLTGDPDVDDELKEQAINYIMQIFRVIANGLDGVLTQWEERVLSTAIQRMYDSAGVTDDPKTWVRSKRLRLHYVYEELKGMVESKELIDPDNDNIRHRAATKIADAASIYFEEGEAKSGTFKHPMSADELYGAKFIIFSFGMKGAANSMNDPTLLALKQLSVACISSQISNHCKYVKHCFNVKVWEEYQRYAAIKGSSDVIVNAMTGGRKRGDVNILITNDLSSVLDTTNAVSQSLRQNIQNFAIGRIRDRGTRESFCKAWEVQECALALERIAKSYSVDEAAGKSGSSNNRYKHAFCIVMDNGKKAIAKVNMPGSLAKSSLFKTGVDVSKANK